MAILGPSGTKCPPWGDGWNALRPPSQDVTGTCALLCKSQGMVISSHAY